MQIILHDQQVTFRGEWKILHHYSINYRYFWHSFYVARKWINFCRLSCVLDNKSFITKNNHICVGIEFYCCLVGVFIYPSCCDNSHSNYIQVGLQDTPTISWFNMEGVPGGPSTEIQFLMILDNSLKFRLRNHCVIIWNSICLGGFIAITETYQRFTDFSSHSIIFFCLPLRFCCRGFD